MGEVRSLGHQHRLFPSSFRTNGTCFTFKCEAGQRWPAAAVGAGPAIQSDVYDSDPAWAQTPVLHHVLRVAAEVCCVGLPAVLKVVSQHVVPVVLLLLFWAVGERHWPVGLDLFQRRVVKGRQVLLGARQQLLLLVCVELGLLAEEKRK